MRTPLTAPGPGSFRFGGTISNSVALARESAAQASFIWIAHRADGPRLRGVPMHVVSADGGASFVSWSWDGRRLVVESDPFGLVPAFVYQRAGDIAISTSIPKLVQEGATLHIDSEALAVFLRLGFFIGSDTPFTEIRAVPPGGRLVWQDGRLETTGGPYTVARSDWSRDDAIDCAIQLTARAVGRRRPRMPFAVPLSGGRDSRHILFALAANGDLPDFTVTVPRLPPTAPEDQKIAAMVAAAVGVPHVCVDRTGSPAAAEARKNLGTSYCSDEHAWFYPMLDYLRDRVPLAYEGIGGSLWTVGWLPQTEARESWRSLRTRDVAERMLAQYSVVEENFLDALLPARQTALNRATAVERLARELRLHADAPDPGKSFHFWNRLRRELTLVPFHLMRQSGHVHTPLVDRDLTEFLLSLEPHIVSAVLSRSDKSFHSDAIRRAFPWAAQVPFESVDAPDVDASVHNRAMTHATARYLLARRKSLRLMRSAYVWPRIAYTLLRRRYAETTPWLARTALYLSQLEDAAA